MGWSQACCTGAASNVVLPAQRVGHSRASTTARRHTPATRCAVQRSTAGLCVDGALAEALTHFAAAGLQTVDSCQGLTRGQAHVAVAADAAAALPTVFSGTSTPYPRHVHIEHRVLADGSDLIAFRGTIKRLRRAARALSVSQG